METANDRPGCPNEISMYCTTLGECELCRYAVRLDRFFFWRCNTKPGEVFTKPIVFEGMQMKINFPNSFMTMSRSGCRILMATT